MEIHIDFESQSSFVACYTAADMNITFPPTRHWVVMHNLDQQDARAVFIHFDTTYQQAFHHSFPGHVGSHYALPAAL